MQKEKPSRQFGFRSVSEDIECHFSIMFCILFFLLIAIGHYAGGKFSDSIIPHNPAQFSGLIIHPKSASSDRTGAFLWSRTSCSCSFFFPWCNPELSIFLNFLMFPLNFFFSFLWLIVVKRRGYLAVQVGLTGAGMCGKQEQGLR